jgi:ribosomal protein S18 acetylase RimI-like enzyme
MIKINHYSSLPFNRIYNLLNELDKEFVPHLSHQVEIDKYSKKLSQRASFILLESDIDLGLIAYYLNEKLCFISSFAIKSEYQGKGYSSKMYKTLIKGINKNIKIIRLEVSKINTKAINFYFKIGFNIIQQNKSTFILENKYVNK